MTKREEKEFKEYVHGVVSYAQTILNVTEWHVFVTIHDKKQEEDKSTDDSGGETYATIAPDFAYKQATINVYKPLRECYKIGQMRMCFSALLHEVCHIITHPLSELSDKHLSTEMRQVNYTLNEQATTAIERALMGLIPSKKWSNPKA